MFKWDDVHNFFNTKWMAFGLAQSAKKAFAVGNYYGKIIITPYDNIFFSGYCIKAIFFNIVDLVTMKI